MFEILGNSETKASGGFAPKAAVEPKLQSLSQNYKRLLRATRLVRRARQKTTVANNKSRNTIPPITSACTRGPANPVSPLGILSAANNTAIYEDSPSRRFLSHRALAALRTILPQPLSPRPGGYSCSRPFSGTQDPCQLKSSSLDSGSSSPKSIAGAALPISCLNLLSNSSWELAISRSMRWGSSVSQYTIIECPMGVRWIHTFSSLMPSLFLDSSYSFRNSPEPETASPMLLTASSCPGRMGNAKATAAISMPPFLLIYALKLSRPSRLPKPLRFVRTPGRPPRA